MKRIHRLLLRFRVYQQSIHWSKSATLPFFRSQTVYDLVVFFIRELEKESLYTKASAVSYNFLLAIFPAIIFLFTLIPYIPIGNFQNKLIELLGLVLPHNAFVAIESTLRDVIKTPRSGLLSFGFLSACFFATNGIHALMRAFNQSAFYRETRTWLQQRWVAFKLTLLLSMSLIATITLLVLGEYLLGFVKTDWQQQHLFWLGVMVCARWLVFIFSYWITVSLLYRYAPLVDNKWPLLNIGACVATILAVCSSVGFSLYINYFNTYNKIYGSIGTLMVVMGWFFLNALILLIGFELNARYFHIRKRMVIAKTHLTNSFRDSKWQ